MPFEKGTSGNQAGRPKGTQNKATDDLRACVKAFIDKNMRGLQKEYNKLDSKDRLLFIEKMLQYVLPRLQSVQVDGSIEIERLSDEQVNQLFDKIMNER